MFKKIILYKRKFLLSIFLFALAIIFLYSSVPTSKDGFANSHIALPSDKSLYPIIFLPSQDLRVLISELVNKNMNRITNSDSYSIYKLEEARHSSNEKNYTLILKKKENLSDSLFKKKEDSLKDKKIYNQIFSNENILEKEVKVTLNKRKFEITTRAADINIISLFESSTQIPFSLGFLNSNHDFYGISDNYEVTFTNTGILLNPSSDNLRAIDLANYFDATAAMQVNGFWVTMPYAYINRFFSINPLFLGAGYEFRNVFFSDSSNLKYLRVTYDIVIRSPKKIVLKSGGIFIDKSSKEVISIKDFDLSPLSPLDRTLAISALKEIDIKGQALRRELLVNLSANQFVYYQGNNKNEIPIKTPANIFYYKDNFLIRINN